MHRPKLLLLMLLLLAILLWTGHHALSRCQRSIIGCGPKYNQRLKEPTQPIAEATLAGSWAVVLAALGRVSTPRHVIIDARYGLGNRLRAVASAMAVAAAADRSLIVIWVPDAHCNCSLRSLLEPPLPFAVFEAELPADMIRSLPTDTFQAFNYMPGEAGSVKREWVRLDQARHLYVRSAYRVAHERGEWPYAARKLRQLSPQAGLVQRLVTDHSMIGMHVRGEQLTLSSIQHCKVGNAIKLPTLLSMQPCKVGQYSLANALG
jgi:hypothetical protein